MPWGREWDPGLLIPLCCLLAFGLIMVTSASIAIAHSMNLPPWWFVARQTLHVFVAVLISALFLKIPSQYWPQIGSGLLLLCLLLLVLVLLPGIGHKVNGAMRWLDLPFFRLQISELVKMAVIFYLAAYLTRHGRDLRQRVIAVLKPLLLTMLVATLLLLEPDLGSAVILLMIVLAMLFVAQVPMRYLLAVAIFLAMCVYALVIFSPYRAARLLSFWNPWQHATQHGYQLTQSLMAIGRGGLWGVGLGQGIQKQQYLPEAHTDFIYAVLCEELGLFGALILLGLFAFLLLRLWQLACKCFARDRDFWGYLVVGILVWLAAQLFVNIGVCVGLLPTKGTTLPFISYGGSALLVNVFVLLLCQRISQELSS